MSERIAVVGAGVSGRTCGVILDALANVLSERKDRTKLGVSKYAAEAADERRRAMAIWPCHATCATLPQFTQRYGRKTIVERGILNLNVLTSGKSLVQFVQASPEESE